MSEIPKGLCQCGCGQKTTIATENVPKWGYVIGEPRPYIRYHRPAKIRQPIDRFSTKYVVDAETGCWVWTAGRHSAGYGLFSVPGETCPRSVYAHRWSYEHHVGPIPKGLHLDHLCRNRACVNPDHLEPVTPAENTRRGMAPSTVTNRTDVCQRGHAMTPDNVYVRPDGTRRWCRECRRIRDRIRDRRSRAA